jgi:hypothetical protein
VIASFECWPDVINQYQKFITADKCFLRVEFPTAPSARNDRQQLQRVREAVELFDGLAAVDNAAFESLLSEFLIHRLERRTGTPRRPRVVWPTWELQLSGTVSTGDAIESQSALTWGQLFGCPDDPWGTSSAFRAAMEALTALGLGTGGNRHNFLASNFWLVCGHEKLMEGSQKLVSQMRRVRPKPFSREMNKLFELRAPPVAHLIAVYEKAALVRTWKQPGKRGKTKVKPEEAAVLPALFQEREVPELTAAIARTDVATLKLVLSDWVEQGTVSADRRLNTGFLLSTLVCGRSLCAAADGAFAALKRSGKFNAWDVQWSHASGLRFGTVLSAFAEAKLTKTLTLSTTKRDGGSYADPVYWTWLAYAFWSRDSRSSIQNLTISRINLTEAHVAAVKKVLASSFPAPAENQSTAPSAYGYLDIRKGTGLRLARLGARIAAALIPAEDCRFRAHYDASSRNGVADVVVPGYGICEVALGAKTTFVSDTLSRARTESGCGIRTFSLTLVDVENDRVLAQLLQLVGKGLQTLSLDFRCVDDRRVSLDLSAVASGCPELKELRLRDWNVVLGDDWEALEAWSIKKLSIRGSREVVELAACLSDPDCHMSRELVELAISPDRIRQWHRLICYDGAYVASLMAHNGEVLPVAKMKIPKGAKCALISVVSGRSGRLQAVQYLDSSILSIIFAATSQSRSVQVAQYPSR